jgi:hypothetical protein
MRCLAVLIVVFILFVFIFMLTVAVVMTAGVFIAYKIHRLIASVVLVAMLRPFFGMAWWHVHINGLLHHHRPLRHYRWLDNDDGLRIDNRWRWSGAYLYSAVNTGLDNAANADVHICLRLRLCAGKTRHRYQSGQTILS